MGFWIFMLIMDLMIPLLLITFGKIFLKNPPKEINSIYGYRTSRSMKNKETWDFAHRYCGKIWYRCGLVMLPVSVAALSLVIGKNEAVTGSVGSVVCAAQTFVLIGAVYPVERALKKNFDRDGKRRCD